MFDRKELPTDDDCIIFSSGKKVYVSHGPIGIDANGNIHAGSDEDIYLQAPDHINFYDLSSADLMELADMMLARWASFKEGLSA